ncbi:hypothetical protein A9G22_07400 [Gilliamella sp. App2-1]|nr:hypothetical protein A9G22_07400 [Gilliamella apicola]
MSLISLENDGLIAIEDENTTWVQVTALDEQTLPIHGWVNIKDNAQAHIKRRSPWHWPGFDTIEEKATVGELSDKIGKNKVAKLDLADYTPAMRALHQILTGTLIYSTQRKKDLPPPTFTDRDLKEGLRRSWTAELIGHLLVKYESEWYADEALSKWNEVDELFEEEKQQQKALIEAGLDKLGITEPYLRDFALEVVDEAHKHVKSNWKIEKEQRIKPSLWWKQVAQAQAQNPTANTEANTPKLSNLSADGKAWFIHPVAMMDSFQEEKIDIIVFYIYLDGRIQKYIPSFIKDENQNKYRYVIVDGQDKKHKVCDLEYIRIKEKVRKAFNPNQPKTFYKTKSPSDIASDVNDEDTKYRIIYANGEIAEWGKHDRYYNVKSKNPNSWRVFGVNNNEVELLRMPDSLNKQYGNLNIEYNFHNSKRRYANPGLFAAMLGSIAVYNKTVTTTGSAFQWGSCFPSVLHINGMAIDFEYKSKNNQGGYYSHSSQQYQDDLAFLNAMRLFFDKIRVGEHSHFKEFRQLSGVVDGGSLHNSHFHADFSLTKIEEIKE